MFAISADRGWAFLILQHFWWERLGIFGRSEPFPKRPAFISQSGPFWETILPLRDFPGQILYIFNQIWRFSIRAGTREDAWKWHLLLFPGIFVLFIRGHFGHDFENGFQKTALRRIFPEIDKREIWKTKGWNTFSAWVQIPLGRWCLWQTFNLIRMRFNSTSEQIIDI